MQIDVTYPLCNYIGSSRKELPLEHLYQRIYATGSLSIKPTGSRIPMAIYMRVRLARFQALRTSKITQYHLTCLAELAAAPAVIDVHEDIRKFQVAMCDQTRWMMHIDERIEELARVREDMWQRDGQREGLKRCRKDGRKQHVKVTRYLRVVTVFGKPEGLNADQMRMHEERMNFMFTML
jgi:hypothetical protein